MLQITPLEASLFLKQEEEVRKLLQLSGVLPINDIFYPHWNHQHSIFLPYGSYGSGKSIFISDDLINKCRTNEYFRCFYGRKILDKVRESQHQTFVDRLKDLRVAHEFDFSEKPNGSMVIIHRKTGNKFLPFGGDNAESLKGIKDPTHIYCDEMDQFDKKDFDFLFSRLRTEKAKTQFIGAFNTERIFGKHWVLDLFFEGEFASKSVKLKTTFRDNYFLNQQDYYEKLCLIANGNMVLLNAIANGEFGIIRTGGEFWKEFREDKHIKPVRYNADHPLHIVVDENVNPYISIACWQVINKNINQVHEIPCEHPNNNAVKAANILCDWLDEIGYSNVIYLYGDSSGNKRSTVDANSISFFEKFMDEVRKRKYALMPRINKSNPRIQLSANFINDIYRSNLYGYSINISNECSTSVQDYIIVKEAPDGTMFKEKKKNKETGVTYEPFGHFSDIKRYFICMLLQMEFMEWSKRKSKRGSIAIPG